MKQGRLQESLNRLSLGSAGERAIGYGEGLYLLRVGIPWGWVGVLEIGMKWD